MNTPARLGIYGACLVAAFGAAFAISSAIVPAEAAAEHSAALESEHGEEHGSAAAESVEAVAGSAALPGLSLSSDGYALQPVHAPGSVGEDGTLEFVILNESGKALTEYEVDHEKELHLIVVRSDGAQFRHVHPTMATDGIWSIPWEWEAAGSYRAFADFVPQGSQSGVTLSRTLLVSGQLEPAARTPEIRQAEIDGYTVNLKGDLGVGGESTLTAEVLRDGVPVTEIEPYLGAFGHLVALRDGDLAYLHVHPTGAEPVPGELSGPEVSFATEAPTEGRYLLYFDFQVDGKTHSAMFALTTSGGATADGHEDSEAH